MTYSYILTVNGVATVYQSSKFLCIHLSHLITVTVNSLLHPSCTVFMLWRCRLFAAWLVFQQFMTILQIVISLKHHTPSKTCEAFLLFIPQQSFMLGFCSRWSISLPCIAHRPHILQYNRIWEGTYAFTCWRKVKLTTEWCCYVHLWHGTLL